MEINELYEIDENEFEINEQEFDKEFDALLEAASTKRMSFDMTPNEEVPEDFKQTVVSVIDKVEDTFKEARGKLEENKVELGKSGRFLSKMTNKQSKRSALIQAGVGSAVSVVASLIFGPTAIATIAAGYAGVSFDHFIIKCVISIIKSCTNARNKIMKNSPKNRYDLAFKYPTSFGERDLISNLNGTIADNIKKLGFKEQDIKSVGFSGRALTMKKNGKIYACVYSYKKGRLTDDYIHCLCLEDTQRNKDKLNNKIPIMEASDMFENLDLI